MVGRAEFFWHRNRWLMMRYEVLTIIAEGFAKRAMILIMLKRQPALTSGLRC
jgi:hypothetical protein